MFGTNSSTASVKSNKKVLLSGIQATGTLHFGNYFGAMKQNIELGNDEAFDSYVFIADYHALTTVKDKTALHKSALEIAAAYIACGLDTNKVTLFRQSSVPEIAELAIILNNVVTVPYLMRAHAFKDHEAKNKEVNAGLFSYPVLMASDILMYGTDVVPVGQDQKQHIEYARDIAGFYNRAWNVEQFKLPQDLIIKDVAVVPGTDGEKMSKSKGNVISLFGTDEEVKKSVMGIVTDSASPDDKKNPDTNTIYNIHKLFLSQTEIVSLRSKFEQGGYGYKQAKDELLETIRSWRTGKKEIYDALIANPDKVQKILEEGGKKARTRAERTMQEVRKQIGFV